MEEVALSFQAGDRVGRWVIRSRLGSGGMGSVYLAEDPGTGARHAVKWIRPSDPEALLRGKREAEAQARVDAHPHVLRVHALEQVAGGLALVLEHAGGGDLGQRLAGGPLPPAEAAHLLRDLARGVAHAHRFGVLHRDLKPENVLFDERGVPKLADFGLARIEGGDSLTTTGTILGTPAYMPPEQARGEPPDERGDVYGLGALLYHCLTGRAPFQGPSLLNVLERVLHDPPRPPRELVPEVPPELEALCLRCLDKSPAGRPASADAVAEALEVWLTSGGSPRRRSPAVWVAVGAALALGSALALATRPSLRGDPPASPRPAVSVAEASPPASDPAPGSGSSADGSLRFLPRYWEKVSPPLTAEERERLEVWRAVYAQGSWYQLGRRLDQTTHLGQDNPPETSTRLALACYLFSWSFGESRAMGMVGRLLTHHAEDPAVRWEGLGLVRALAERPEAPFDAAELLGRAYLQVGLSTWEDLIEPNPKLASAWFAVARAQGLDAEDYRDGRARFDYQEPASEAEAWRWIEEQEALGRSVRVPDLFADGVAAQPSARERLVRLALELAPLRLDELAAGLVVGEAELRELERVRAGKRWGQLGKRFDVNSRQDPPEGYEEDRRRALACYWEAVQQEGSNAALRRLSPLLTSSDPDLGFRCLLWAAICGDEAARTELADLYARRLDDRRTAHAWVFLGHAGESVEQRVTDPALLADELGQAPTDVEMAWRWAAQGLSPACVEALSSR